MAPRRSSTTPRTPRTPRAAAGDGLPRTSPIETVRVLSGVLAPLVGRGLIIRRPRVVAMSERLDLDRRAVHQLQRLRARHGPGPLVVRLPFRRLALVLDPEHVHRVLQESPEPFTPANVEKTHALAQFQPAGVLISEGAERADRRRFNEAVLDTPAPVHGAARPLLAKLREEAAGIVAAAEGGGELDWNLFITGWYRMVRRVSLGDAAADDHELTDMLARLRAGANWSYLRPDQSKLRRRFLDRLRGYVEAAEPGSLAGLVPGAPSTDATHPHQQFPQWLFAFDPAGIATFRALALLGAHPDHQRRIRDGLADRDLTGPQELPDLRATLYESLRLWPTTPGILRDTTRDTTWEQGRLPAGAGIVVFAPFFHRDDQRLPQANRFAPELWSEPDALDGWPLVPFSAGPVVCPGENLVLLLGSTMLACLLERHAWRLEPRERLEPARGLPSILNPYDLRFRPTTAADGEGRGRRP